MVDPGEDAQSDDILTIALVGQPNCGKSTIFNAIAGFKVNTGNFPGTTVSYTETIVYHHGRRVRIVDLPGIYSFYTGDRAEKVAMDYLLEEDVDIVINIIDASVLSRNLEFTMELAEIRLPTVVCLNMIDEAERKGVDIDKDALSKLLGVPVVETIGHRGIGVDNLFHVAKDKACIPALPKYERDVQRCIRKLEKVLGSRSAAIWYLEKIADPGPARDKADEIRCKIENRHGEDAAEIISGQRHKKAMEIFEATAKVTRPGHGTWRERVDRQLLHPVIGFFFLFLVFLAMLGTAFLVGDFLSTLIVEPLEAVGSLHLSGEEWHMIALRGLWEGVIGGVGIVIPYMIPLMFILGLLEDVGYMARAAYILDRIFHLFGLHGKAAGPFLLGYGCTVPAIMATRIMEDERDRIKLAFLTPMIPCSARSVIILALIAGIFGPLIALVFYIVNIVAIALAGGIISKLIHGKGYGLIMDMPDLKIPSFRTVRKKTYFIVYEFALMAWPIIIIGSVILAYMEAYGLSGAINSALSPFTVMVLGLPVVLGFTLIFGIFRKELALLMTLNALGVSGTNISEITDKLDAGQIFTYVTFITFYVPCLSTLAIMQKEFGSKYTTYAVLFNVGFATLLALIVRVLFMTVEFL